VAAISNLSNSRCQETKDLVSLVGRQGSAHFLLGQMPGPGVLDVAVEISHDVGDRQCRTPEVDDIDQLSRDPLSAAAAICWRCSCSASKGVRAPGTLCPTSMTAITR
jgi:hypothetical protein